VVVKGDILNAANTLGLRLGEMTINDYVAVAEKSGVTLGQVVVAEEMHRADLSEEDTLAFVNTAFAHNYRALDIGLSDGKSYLLGTVGNDLATMRIANRRLLDDAFLDDAVRYILGSQAGNHEVGLEPCAGTGGSANTKNYD